MTVAGEPPRAPAAWDAVSFAWGDPDAMLFGQARLELSPGPGGARSAGGHAVLFAGHEPVALRAASGLHAEALGSWDDVAAAGVRTRELTPAERWEARFTGDDGTSGFALRFDALGAPADSAAVASIAPHGAGSHGQLCRVTGVATVGAESFAVDCLGQREQAWSDQPPVAASVTRSAAAWLDPELAVSVTAVAPPKAKSHADAVVTGTLFAPVDPDSTVAALPAATARLSTTSDAAGRARRAGIELFLDEDDPGHRAAGRAVCGTSFDAGDARLDVAFFAWRMAGRTGVGSYDVRRRRA